MTTRSGGLLHHPAALNPVNQHKHRLLLDTFHPWGV